MTRYYAEVKKKNRGKNMKEERKIERTTFEFKSKNEIKNKNYETSSNMAKVISKNKQKYSFEFNDRRSKHTKLY